jgi:hypothetical protein
MFDIESNTAFAESFHVGNDGVSQKRAGHAVAELLMADTTRFFPWVII